MRLLKKIRFVGITLLLVGSFCPSTVLAEDIEASGECQQVSRFTFSWTMVSDSACLSSTPRGGTSRGAPLILDPEPHAGWLSLQEEGLSPYEKDRRAILAMAGPYRTSFEFIEIAGYTPDFSRDRPYQSWGTEYVYVVDEQEDFISLQHIMVMFIDTGEEGGIVGPIVQKHWRQDWQFEKNDLYAFIGNDQWAHREFSAEQVAGTWAQSVFQVDDSPRYEAFGQWEHKPNFSTWISEETWRPVPRRETSIRDDYQILEGTNRHTIMPNGWIHEEQNYKVQLNAEGDITGAAPYLSKEIGVNRYEKIIDFDFSAGDEYWQSTGPFWQDARIVWQNIFSSAEGHTILSNHDGVPLFAVLFELAEEYPATEAYDSKKVQAVLMEALGNYIN